MSKTFYKCLESQNTETLIESVPSQIAYEIAKFCDYYEEGVPILFTNKDLPKLREYYRQVRAFHTEFSTSTTTVGRVTSCGIDADYILEILIKIGRTLHKHKVFMI